MSYDFKKGGNKSVNGCTPKDKCSVKYPNMDRAMETCFAFLEEEDADVIYFSKTDIKNAFRVLPLKVSCIKWLIMKVENPLTRKMVFFVEKCLPFSASISCSHFQRFSNALRHIFEFKSGKRKTLTNYLDDFLYVARLLALCNKYVWMFLDICEDLRVPMAMEKTEWADCRMTFLGMLLDGKMKILLIPLDKIQRTVNQLKLFVEDGKKKAMIKDLQSITGLLNFFTRVIYPGRAFTRCMYAKFTVTLLV